MGGVDPLVAQAEIPAEVTLLKAAISRFCDAPLPAGGSALATFLSHLRPSIDTLEVKFSEAAAAFAETDEYDNQACYAPIHWIRTNCHMSAGAAADRVAVGQKLQSLPESHQSMVEGGIGFAHLAHLARAARGVEAGGPKKAI